MKTNFRCAFWGYMTVAMLTAGCARGPSYAVVDGTIKLNGKPLDDVFVEFLPDVDQGTAGLRSTATTDQDGHYQLVADDQHAGAVAGKHRVVLSDLKPYGGKFEGRYSKPVCASRIPRRYTDAAQTPLRKEIPQEKQATIDLEVVSR